uniref:ORF2 n=1 Tax=Chimpanzee anellovirus TaxID=1743410 RepID=A0A0S2GMK9_9VIRU|nr:ORF2 [Chimpanzee anellovirus]
MSKLLTPALYKGKSLENQWINGIFHQHDLFCGCHDPITHLLTVLNRQGKAPKPESEIPNIKCLITGEDNVPGEDVDAFGPGELEALFADGPTADTAEPTTSTG